MPTVTQILGMRKHRVEKSQRDPSRKFAMGCSCVISLFSALAVIVIAFFYASITKDLPSVEVLPSLIEGSNSPLYNPTRFYDRSGDHLLLTLKNPFTKDSKYLPFHNGNTTNKQTGDRSLYLPDSLITATIAYADPHFWEHPGFNIHSKFRLSEPSLAQHLVNEFLLFGEPPSLIRTFRERLLAAQITSRFGRGKVLEWYLNSKNYGNLAYGIDAASRLYFDKPATKLDLAEAALLVGVAQSPALNPLNAPQAALENQKFVIQEMLRQRVITPGEGVLAAQQELSLRPSTPSQWYFMGGELAPAFLLLSLEQVDDQIPRSRLQRGGYKVYTTLNYELQSQALCSTATQLLRMQSDPNWHQSIVQTCQADRLLPDLPDDKEISLEDLNAEVVILESQNGQILALTGLSSNGSQVAHLNAHPLGSLATPFIYLTAFTRGMSPATLVWDIPPKDGSKSIQNFDNEYNGPQRLRNAFANDYLVPAQNIIEQVGLENVWRSAQQFGVQFSDLVPINQNPSLDIFGELDLLKITHAYSVFANQGVLSGHKFGDHSNENEFAHEGDSQLAPLEPTTILKVTNFEDQVFLDWTIPQTRPIISPQLNYLMTDVMSDETARWPSLGHPNALEIGQPAAAKLGRTQKGNSNWTIGYTPQLTLGVWMGEKSINPTNLENTQIRQLQQATAGIWHAIIRFSNEDLAHQNFPVPPGITNMQVCDPSGLLPTDECPNLVDEVFLAGNEPVQSDNLFKKIQINRNVNHLASVFTPPDLIDSRTYMLVSNEAEDWMLQSGIEIPPQIYDSIPSEITTWSDAQITSPEMFNICSGKIPIMGKAAGKIFDFYRIQVGAGLNPQFWYQIGEDSFHPVSNGELAIWNTNDLNGLFAIQLLVVHQDRSVERTTTLVTIDNQSPITRISNPIPGEIILQSQLPVIVLQANVQDELGIEQVEFYLNDKFLKRLTQPPFTVSWNTKLGTYELRVHASDRAGNSSRDSITFQVK